MYSFNCNYPIIKLCTHLVLWLNVELLHHLDGEPDGVLIVAGHHDTNPLRKNKFRNVSNYNLQKHKSISNVLYAVCDQRPTDNLTHRKVFTN